MDMSHITPIQAGRPTSLAKDVARLLILPASPTSAPKDNKKKEGKVVDIRIKIGNVLRRLALRIMPDYWVCTDCGHIHDGEAEARCWKCSTGEMVYKGDNL